MTWVPHVDGIPTGNVQVSNFSDLPQGAEYLRTFPSLVPVAIVDSDSITCLHCFMTSYSLEDVRHRFCGNCHRFHGGG